MADLSQDLNQFENLEHSETPGSTPPWYKVRVVEADVEATMLLQNALVLIDENEINIAREVLRSISASAKKNPNVLFWLIQTEIRSGNYEVALQLSEQLYDIIQDFVSTTLMAECLYRLGRDDRAKDYYFRALNSEHGAEELLFDCYKNLGNIFVRNADFKSAEEFYFKAMALNENSDTLQVNLGTLAIQQQDLEAAAGRFRTALELNPKNDRAWVGLAIVHRQYSDYDLAWGNLVRAMDLNSRNQTAVQLALAWASSNEQWEQIEEHLINGIEEECLNLDLSLTLSKVLYRNGKFNLARIELARAEALGAEPDQIRKMKQLIAREVC